MNREIFSTMLEKSSSLSNEELVESMSELNKKILNKYGANDAFVLFFEEVAEVTQELCKFWRDDPKKDLFGLIEELADISIVIERIEQWINHQLEGLTTRSYADIMARAVEIKLDELRKKHIV